jgi:energy-coupling factor transporter ATP-binding protein EcfA2
MPRQTMRVSDVPLWEIGGAGRFRDALVLPPWLFLLGVAAWWWVRRPMLLAMVVLGIWCGAVAGLPLAVIVVALLMVLRTGARVVWAARGCSPASPGILCVGMWRLWHVRRRWTDCCEAANVLSRVTRRPVPVRRWRIRPTGVQCTARVGRVGRTVSELRKGVAAMAAVTGAEHVDVQQLSTAMATVTFLWGDVTTRELETVDLPGAPEGRASFGWDMAGKAVSVYTHLSLLIIGRTGSGKSTLAWALIASLIREGVPFRVRVIDPAGGVEMSLLEDAPYVRYYTDKIGNAGKLIEQARDSMRARLHDIKERGIRKHVATPDEPLDITIIDEILLLNDVLQKGAASPAGEILTVGRKAGYVIWGLSQLGQVDALGRIRDLFAQRVCLATTSPEITNAALGQEAESAGAKCSEIPLTAAGTGYLYIDGVAGFRKFRSVYVTDEDTRHIALGKLPHRFRHGGQQYGNQTRRTAVYECYDITGRLLYVGIAYNPSARLQEHSEEDFWWAQVDQTKTVITWWKSRKSAKREETKQIHNRKPLFNIQEQQAEDEDGDAA